MMIEGPAPHPFTQTSNDFPNSPFKLLMPELFRQIFSFLGIPEMDNLQLTCKGFKKLTEKRTNLPYTITTSEDREIEKIYQNLSDGAKEYKIYVGIQTIKKFQSENRLTKCFKKYIVTTSNTSGTLSIHNLQGKILAEMPLYKEDDRIQEWVIGNLYFYNTKIYIAINKYFFEKETKKDYSCDIYVYDNTAKVISRICSKIIGYKPKFYKDRVITRSPVHYVHLYDLNNMELLSTIKVEGPAYLRRG